MELGCCLDSISLWCIVPFMPFLNSSTKDLSLYPLSLTALLNSYINFSIVFPLCLIFFSFATLTISLSLPPNFFFIIVLSLDLPKCSSSIYPLILLVYITESTESVLLLLLLLSLSWYTTYMPVVATTNHKD